MKELKHYDVYENSDKTEGRGPMRPTGIAFTSERDAINFTASDRYKPFAVMGYVDKKGAPYAVRQSNVKVFESLRDYDDYQAIGIRERALSKLTKEEQIALGLAPKL